MQAAVAGPSSQGLGISHVQVPPRATPSPTRGPTSATTATPNKRHLPSPPSNARASPSRPTHSRGAHQGSDGIALRPTHTRATSMQTFATFSAIPPSPGGTLPSPSQLRTPGHAKSSDGHESGRKARDDVRGMVRTPSKSSTKSARGLRRSVSNELLRKFSDATKRSETISGGRYVPLAGDETGSPQFDLATTPGTLISATALTPASAAMSSAATPAQSQRATLDPTPSMDLDHSFLPNSFPAPPSQAPQLRRGTTRNRSQSQPQAPLSSITEGSDYQLRFSGYSNEPLNPAAQQRISGGDPGAIVHSQNAAILSAERGGLLRYSSAEGWQPGSLSNLRAKERDSYVNPNPSRASIEDELRARPWSESTMSQHRPRHVRSLSEGATLARQGTLLHPASSEQRASQELGILLGNRSKKPAQSRLLPPPELTTWTQAGAGNPERVRIEAAKKRRAKVEVDVVLERECVVEGGELRGRMEITVNDGKNDGLRIGGGKVRVIGFEDLNPKDRHMFYHIPHPLPLFEHPPRQAPPRSSLFASDPDEEGYRLASVGTHHVPFRLRLPLHSGAKGSYSSNGKGPAVRYVVVGSVKLFVPTTGKRSIAHFYRNVVVLPYLNPGIVLAPSVEPIESRVTKGLGWNLSGEKGDVDLRVALGRGIWVSGQRLWCEVGIINRSNRRIKTMHLALLQTVQTFHTETPTGPNIVTSFNPETDPFALSTSRRKVAEEVTEADAHSLPAGSVTGKQWWTGVAPGDRGQWDLSLLVPPGMITIRRDKLIEVSYNLRVTLNGSIYVDTPITLINFLSIDPPPMPGDGARLAQATAMPMQASVPTSQQSHVRQGNYQASEISAESTHHAARASSTTLHVDALLQAGRARAIASGGDTDGASAVLAKVRPLSMGSAYTPESSNGAVSALPSPMPHRPRPAPLTRPANGNRAISYLSVRSSDTLPFSEEEEADDHEEDRALLEAARREGRKMSLAAISRAMDRAEADGQVQPDEPTPVPAASALEDLLSPIEEKEFAPLATPSEEHYRMLGNTPSMMSHQTPAGSATPRTAHMRSPPMEEAPSSGMTGLAPPQLSADYDEDQGSHMTHDSATLPYTRQEAVVTCAANPTSHTSSPEVIEAVEVQDGLTPPVDAEPTLGMLHPGYTGFNTTDEGAGSPATGVSSQFQSGEGPSTSRSDLAPQALHHVPAERLAHISNTRTVYGSFAPSFVSEQESEVGQVQQAVKRNLSVRVPPELIDMDQDESKPLPQAQPQLHISIPKSSSSPYLSPNRGFSYTPSPPSSLAGRKASSSLSSQSQGRGSPMRRESSSASVSTPLKTVKEVPSPLQAQQRESPHGKMWSSRPPYTFTPPSAAKHKESSLSPRGGRDFSPVSPRNSPAPISPGPSPRTAMPSTLSPGSKLDSLPRRPSGNSQLRHQVSLADTPPDESVPALAPSVASDSASSDGHSLESPPAVSVARAPGLAAGDKDLPGMMGLLSMTTTAITSADAPVLPDLMAHHASSPMKDSSWVPSADMRALQVNLVQGQPHHLGGAGGLQNEVDLTKSPLGAESAMSHESAILPSRPGTPASSSNHSVMLPAVQARLAQLEVRNEALRKFSVASAVSAASNHSYANEVLNPVPDVPSHRPSLEVPPTERTISKRRSYTAALAPRTAKSSTEDRPEPSRAQSDDYEAQFQAAYPNAIGHTTHVAKKSYADPWASSPPFEAYSIGSSRSGGGETAAPPPPQNQGWGSPISVGNLSPIQLSSPTGYSNKQLGFTSPTLMRNASVMSASSTSTTATAIERALLSRPAGGPAGPRSPIGKRLAAVATAGIAQTITSPAKIGNGPPSRPSLSPLTGLGVRTGSTGFLGHADGPARSVRAGSSFGAGSSYQGPWPGSSEGGYSPAGSLNGPRAMRADSVVSGLDRSGPGRLYTSPPRQYSEPMLAPPRPSYDATAASDESEGML